MRVTTIRANTLQRLKPAVAFPEHPEVGEIVEELRARAERGGASSIMFLPAAGVPFEAFAFGYHTGLAKEMNLKAGAGSLLHGTLVINVSGHATGSIDDRLLGFAEAELQARGLVIGDDARRFLALRDACAEALAKLPGAGGGFELVFEGEKLTLTAALLQRLAEASVDHADPDLAALAHLGNHARRKVYGAENTYHVRIRSADGKTIDVEGIERNHPERIEYATRIPLELPLHAGVTVLEAWPTGSAGAEGYVEARRYRIHVGKDLFDEAKARAGAQRYEAAHPEVRWGTPHERDDLDLHQLSPSPRPYPDF